MWLGIVWIIVGVIALIAGLFAGGAFTLILVPIAVLAGIAALVTLAILRISGKREATRADAGGPGDVGRPEDNYEQVPETADQLLKARRAAQGR
ncbi:MAG: hypothetical protein J2O48_11130 [Solirubrobacterales bacterium]|nr:hypothetical protein [Solirubrobacterales bacterium]